MKNILCYGDSNTWGFTPLTGERYAPDVRWTGVMQRELGAGWRVIEEGLNARTSAYEDMRDFWRNGRDYLPACLISQKPLDLLVLSLGTNDLKFTGAFGAAKGVESLIALADMVQNKKEDSLVFPHGLKVLVISPIRLGERIAENVDTNLAHSYPESCLFAKYFSRICQVHGAGFLDAAQYAQPLEKDCIHMEPEGHLALGKAAARKVREMLG